MFRRNRGPDNWFSPRDHLYRRCTREDVEGDRLIPARIQYENVSVNWSRYSKPWDVVFEHPGEGIVRFVVRDLPEELPKELPPAAKEGKKQPPVKVHCFRPAHQPLEYNYAHSEIWTFKEGERITKVSLPVTVKKEFRQIMSDRSLILHQPQI